MCDAAKAVVLEIQKRIPFELVEVDVTADSALFECFRYDVPVVFIEGQKAFKHRVPADLLEQRLRHIYGI